MESKKILVVDDEPGICLGLSAALQNWGHNVVTAFNGKEAVAWAKKHIPDVIFLALVMPKMDGFEPLKCLKSDTATSHIPVVMITAKSEMPDKIKASEMYVDHYITKPITLDVLKGILNIVFPSGK